MNSTDGPSNKKDETVIGTAAALVEASGIQVTVNGVRSKLIITYEATMKSVSGDEDENADSSASDLNNSSDLDSLEVGCIKDADVLLVLENGESLFAHSKCLKNNPYFASHFNFLETNASSCCVRAVRALPPFPSAFRTIIELIYNFCGKHPDESKAIAFNSLNVKQFVPLFENAQFFQMQPLIDACVQFFAINWEGIIKKDSFSPKDLPEHSLCILLDHIASRFEISNCSSSILTIIVRWCNHESREFSDTAESCSEIRQIDGGIT